MNLYRKLKITTRHGYAEYIPGFDKTFPELKHLNSEELADRFRKLKMDFYYEEKTKVSPGVRLTLPFALILMLLMFIWMPFNFIFSGNWGYELGEKNKIYNWFRSLRLL